MRHLLTTISSGFVRRPAAAAVVGAMALLAIACAPPSSDAESDSVDTSIPPARSVATTTTAVAGPGPAPLPSSFLVAGERKSYAGCPTFPRDHAFHASIGSLPVRSDSAQRIATAGASLPLLAGFGSTIWLGSRPGIPVNVVDGTQASWQPMLLGSAFGSSDGDQMPWPTQPRFEGWPGSAWDRHLLVVDSSTCRTWEALQVQPPWENLWAGMFGRWWADKVISIDLRSNTPRPGGTVTASGFSMLAGLVSYEEVQAGVVDHVLAMSLPEIRAGEVVWPAQGTDGRSARPTAPQMGSWFRLKSTANLADLGPQAKVVARALQEHGAILADTGPHASLSGQPDTRWDDSDLGGLAKFTLADFEIVDASAMKVADNSFQIR